MTAPRIWVDADACPNVIKDILFRAVRRTGMTTTLVANQHLALPRISGLSMVVVPAGLDAADSEIIARCDQGDLVITADIPLAAEAIGRGADALNPRGERYTSQTVRALLTMCDFMDTMRASVIVGGGPPPLTLADRNRFAGELDRWLHEAARPDEGGARL